MKTVKYDPNNPDDALEMLADIIKRGGEALVVPADPYRKYKEAEERREAVQYLNADITIKFHETEEKTRQTILDSEPYWMM